jgi:hypothetical protein
LTLIDALAAAPDDDLLLFPFAAHYSGAGFTFSTFGRLTPAAGREGAQVVRPAMYARLHNSLGTIDRAKVVEAYEPLPRNTRPVAWPRPCKRLIGPRPNGGDSARDPATQTATEARIHTRPAFARRREKRQLRTSALPLVSSDVTASNSLLRLPSRS